MPRLLGVDIPGDKRIEASLPYIYGMGPSNTKKVLEQANIDPNARAKDLSPEQLNAMASVIAVAFPSVASAHPPMPAPARDHAKPWAFSATKTPKPAKSNPAFY